MRQASTEFKRIMKEHIRNAASMSVSLGVVNQEAQATAQATGGFLPYSTPQMIFNNKEKSVDYATFEPNYFKADGSMLLAPEGMGMSNYLIARDFMEPVTIQLQTSYDIKGLTIEFPDNCYPTEFTVTDSNNLIRTYEIEEPFFSTQDTWFGIEYLIITPVSMVGGNKRLRIKNLVLGVGLVFTDTDIINATYSGKTSSISEDVSYGNFDLTVSNYDNKYNVDNDESFINFLETGQAVAVSIGLLMDDDSIEWLEYGTFYLNKWSANREKMQFKSSDRMTFSKVKYTAGNYIHERTLYDDAIAVLTDFGLEPDQYIVDEYLRDISVRNPLPEQTHSKCLQLIANAGRCICYQNSKGQIIIRANFGASLSPEDVTVTGTGYTAYSKLENVNRGADILYADFTRDFFTADGTMYLVPRNAPYTLDSGYISQEVADASGNFTTNPTLSLELEAGFAFFGVSIDFGGNHPQEMIIHTFHNGSAVENVTVTVVEKNTYVFHPFKTFDKMTFEFTKGAPLDRVIVQKAAFGDLTDYSLRRKDMTKNPVGTKEEKAKNVSVRIYSYYEDEEQKPKEIKDSVYQVRNVFTSGQEVVYANPLIGDPDHASDVAKWIGNFYGNNITYKVDFRGDPRLEPADIIYMDSDYMNNLQVEISKLTFKYNGTFSGSLELRRAINTVEDDG